MTERTTVGWEPNRDEYVEARLDVNGRYSATLPRAGRYSMSVYAPAETPTWRQVEAKSSSMVDAKLGAPGFELEARIRDPNEQPIAHAPLFFYSHSGQLVAHGATDQSGVLRQRLPGGVYYLGLSGPGFASRLERRLVVADERATLVLTPARPLDVQALSQGRALSGAHVALVNALGHLAAEGTTDESGNLRLAHVVPGKYEAWAAHGTLTGSVTLTLTDTSHPALHVPMDPQRQAALEVATDGDCRPEVTMVTSGLGGRRIRQRVTPSVTAHPAGNRLALALIPIRQNLLIDCGGRSARLEYLPKPEDTQPVRPGAHFYPNTRVQGRVLAPDGSALAAAAVRYEVGGGPSPESGAAWSVLTLTDAGGNFRMEGLPAAPGAPGVLRIYDPRFGSLTQALDEQPAIEPLELRFDPKHYVEGHVRTTSGDPVGGADVAFASASGAGLSARSTADGTFRIGPVAAEQGFLLVFNQGEVVQDRPLLVMPEASARVSLVVHSPRL